MSIQSILFSRFKSYGGSQKYNDIYTIEPDGSGETAITSNPDANGKFYDHAVGVFNNDHSKIAFLSSVNSPAFMYNVFIKDMITGSISQITRSNHDFGSIDWAPDDSHFLVSALDANETTQIFSLNNDGTGLTALTAGSAENFSPTYSPADAAIAFEKTPDPSNRDINQIWMMDSNGANPVLLSPQLAYAASPSWSPDGNWIVFAFEQSGQIHIRKMNPVTGETISLTPASSLFSDMQPVWTATGIVFSSNRDHHGDIHKANLYIMDSNGGNVRRLTSTDAYEYAGFGFMEGSSIRANRTKDSCNFTQ